MRKKLHVRLLWLAFLDDIDVVNHLLVVALRSYNLVFVLDNFGHLSFLALSSKMSSSDSSVGVNMITIFTCLKTGFIFGLIIYTKYIDQLDIQAEIGHLGSMQVPARGDIQADIGHLGSTQVPARGDIQAEIGHLGRFLLINLLKKTYIICSNHNHDQCMVYDIFMMR